MADEPNKSESKDGHVILRLVKDAGITEQQARELVGLLGSVNWSSLIREARLLNRKP